MFDDLIKKKNYLIQDLGIAKDNLDTVEITRIAIQVANLEKEIAEYLIGDNRKEEAVINLISAASCYLDAEDKKSAKEILEFAHCTTKLISLKNMIQHLIEGC